jgi:hypothetical protein
MSLLVSNKAPVSVVLSVPESVVESLSFRFYIFGVINAQSILLFSSSLLKLSLSYYNILNLSLNHQVVQLADHLPCNCWNTVVLKINYIQVNSLPGLTIDLPVLAFEYLTLGSDDLVALIEFPQYNFVPSPGGNFEYVDVGLPVPLLSLNQIALWQPISKGNISRIPLLNSTKSSPRKLPRPCKQL